MRNKIIKLIGLVAVASSVVLGITAQELKLIKYECLTNYSTFWRVTNYLKSDIGIFGMEHEETNSPICLTHMVTYGIGTNALFVLHSSEPLPNPEGKWESKDWKQARAWTWITKPE